MKFGLPPWLKRVTPDAALTKALTLVKYAPVVDLTDADESNGWTPESLAAYHAESDARAMAIVASSMDAHRRAPGQGGPTQPIPRYGGGDNSEGKT